MIHLATPYINADAQKNILQCLKENWLSQGEFNKKFEKTFAQFCKTTYASTCTNGTIALWLALKAIGIGPGDEVIVPSFTFAATASAVVQTGARPVFVDIDEKTLAISATTVEPAITPQTKAVIVVHLYGIPAEMKPLQQLTKKHKIFLIEDAAEALGSEYHGKKVGSIGDIGCFSFYANKVITTGEGGMCITKNKKLYKQIELYKNHGMRPERRYWHEIAATNGRMTNLHAAIGVAQMKDIQKIIQKRKQLSLIYQTELKNEKHINLLTGSSYTSPVPWLTAVRIHNSDKEKIVSEMEKFEIETRPGFYACHRMPAFRNYIKKENCFPITEKIEQEIVCLPMHPALNTKDVHTICSALRKTTANLL